MPVVQVAKKLGGVFHVATRLEHLGRGAEVFAVKIVVDLHASDIDELAAFPFGGVESGKRLLPRGRIESLAFDIHRIGIKAPLAAGLRQAHRVKDAFRHPVLRRCRLDFLFTGSG